MGKVPALASAKIEGLRRLDSATVANAVETFGVRLPNTGFTDSRIHCLFPDFPPMVDIIRDSLGRDRACRAIRIDFPDFTPETKASPSSPFG